MFDVKCLIFDVKKILRSRCATRTLTIKHPPSNIPHGISLVEILISLFVLLFGLMGVASIFPVGNHYVVEGEKFDLGSNLAQNAFEELGCRGLLRPEVWLYSDPNGNVTTVTGNTEFIQPSGATNPSTFNITSAVGPGHAFVIDPMGTAADLALTNLDVFPYYNIGTDSINTANPWNTTVPVILSGTRWPVRRLTFLDATGLMSTAVAETIFRLRDDLVVNQPEEGDRPSIQTWDLDGGALLRRQYKGDYTWLATVVPTTAQALAALQPADPGHAYGNYRYDVSVVVFRKRDVTPSLASERLISAELESDGNLVIYGTTTQMVDAAVEDVRPGNWIALAGVNQTTGAFMMKWYRLLSLDKETVSENDANYQVQTQTGDFELRFAMLDGPSWPANSVDSYKDLRAIILPGAISVSTQELTMEGGTLRSFE